GARCRRGGPSDGPEGAVGRPAPAAEGRGGAGVARAGGAGTGTGLLHRSPAGRYRRPHLGSLAPAPVLPVRLLRRSRRRGAAMTSSPVPETRPARLLAAAGVAGDVAATHAMKESMHPLESEPLETGRAGAKMTWAERLAIAGGIGAVLGG